MEITRTAGREENDKWISCYVAEFTNLSLQIEDEVFVPKGLRASGEAWGTVE
jgi:hypothetical protein